MKERTITIAGKAHPLRFSLRVVKACKDRYGSLDEMFAAIQGKGDGIDIVDECLWLLETMLDAGWRCGMANGQNPPDPPDMDTLLDVLDLEDVQLSLVTAIAGDNARTVEADPPKNGGDAEPAQQS